MLALYRGKSINLERSFYTGAKNIEGYERFCSKFVKEVSEGPEEPKLRRLSFSLPQLSKSVLDKMLSSELNASVIHVSEPLGSDFPALRYLHQTYR